MESSGEMGQRGKGRKEIKEGGKDKEERGGAEERGKEMNRGKGGRRVKEEPCGLHS